MKGLRLLSLSCLFIIIAAAAVKAEEIDDIMEEDDVLALSAEKRSPLMKILDPMNENQMPAKFERTKRGFWSKLKNAWKKVKNTYNKVKNVVNNVKTKYEGVASAVTAVKSALALFGRRVMTPENSMASVVMEPQAKESKESMGRMNF